MKKATILFAALALLSCSSERANVEYQIVVTDTMLDVYNGDEHIGRVKLQGQLDSLLVDYNQ